VLVVRLVKENVLSVSSFGREVFEDTVFGDAVLLVPSVRGKRVQSRTSAEGSLGGEEGE
jgi:hypothetical protein